MCVKVCALFFKFFVSIVLVSMHVLFVLHIISNLFFLYCLVAFTGHETA